MLLRKLAWIFKNVEPMMIQLNVKKSPFLAHFNSFNIFMDTLQDFNDKDPEYYDREEVIPEKDHSSFINRTHEAIESLLQLSSEQSESNPVPEVVDVDDGGVCDRIEDGDVIGGLIELQMVMSSGD